ncbi:hypothetical protein [Reinekea sp. G2M2-21]|uniref:DUF6976 family protein n=1 Tax=Reinekea sp. G2M2-21 TaxID=2788942 RepID=UPI0018A8AE1F|nr:hypothetical protein [Reinekea sp. G2M2-21]
MTTFKNQFLTLQETISLINAGAKLAIAGDHEVLKRLPPGDWIAGTTANFMTELGGVTANDKLFVTEIKGAQNVKLQVYSIDTISGIGTVAANFDLTLLIIPAQSQLHSKYAEDAPGFPNLFDSAITGWISGVPVEDIGTEKRAKVAYGRALGLRDNAAVALHVKLQKGEYANVDIINTFEPDPYSPKIQFLEKGFSVTDAIIDGKRVNFADYCRNHSINTQFPLVGDATGARMNVSFQAINGAVTDFYAPVVKGMTYQFAKPLDNYLEAFENELTGRQNLVNGWSCNCILNYLYSGLEGKSTKGFIGPITFGEVAYHLVNQTLALVDIQRDAA